MNRSIRRVALALGLAFAALFANLNIVQVGRSRELVDHPNNRRLIVREYSIERGQVIARGETVAESVPTKDNLKFLRRYPLGDLFGHISGFYSLIFGRHMIEDSYNLYLTGDEPATTRDFIDELLGRPKKGNAAVLTIDPQLQRVAREALGGQRGGVAAIDPETGAVLALWGNPSYDPSPLSSHDPGTVREAHARFDNDPNNSMRSRAFQETYPPGSTFKIITAAAALELGKMTPESSVPFQRSIRLPGQTRPLHNFGGSSCGGSMRNALRVSCNTAFAQFGMRTGWDKFVEMATRFGLNREATLDIPAVRSCVRAVRGRCETERRPTAELAKSAIGQQSVRVTPLQMALVTAAVANGGYYVHPHVVAEIRDPAGFTVKTIEPVREGPIYSTRTAKWLREMMIEVVTRGTGRVVGFRGRGIGGKTGTAQTGIEDEPPHVWFVAFAPGIAVAVVVENGGDLRSEATGGKVAGPIVRKVIEAFRARRRG